MKQLKIILKGGLKSCCSTYRAEELKEFTKHWFENSKEINFDILDIEEDYWASEPIADLAYKHFKDMIFPLVYIDDILVATGKFPERDECLQFVNSPIPITENDILNAGKRINQP